jgi:hypothetical protein
MALECTVVFALFLVLQPQVCYLPWPWLAFWKFLSGITLAEPLTALLLYPAGPSSGGLSALTQLQLMERLGTLPTKLAQQPWSAPSVVTQLTPERLQVGGGRWKAVDAGIESRAWVAKLGYHHVLAAKQFGCVSVHLFDNGTQREYRILTTGCSRV